MLSWWHRDVIAAGKLPLMLCFVSFVVTFASTRTITRLIRDGRGPFRNVAIGGTHIHHSVPGIILLIMGAFTAVGGPGTLGWLSFSAIAVGIGTSLVLDEFAMILHLQDVYWSGEGQLSVEAVSLVAACLGLALVGFSPVHVNGIDSVEFSLRISATGVLVIDACLALICILKGKYRSGLFGLFLPPVGAHRRGKAGPAEFDLGAAPLSRQAAGARHPPGRGLRPPLETTAGRLAGLHRRPAVAPEPDAQPDAAGSRRPRRRCRLPDAHPGTSGGRAGRISRRPGRGELTGSCGAPHGPRRRLAAGCLASRRRTGTDFRRAGNRSGGRSCCCARAGAG